MTTYAVEVRYADGDTETYKDLVADGVMPDMPHRFFVDEKGNRFEVPYEGTTFGFSKERSEMIAKQAAEKAANQ